MSSPFTLEYLNNQFFSNNVKTGGYLRETKFPISDCALHENGETGICSKPPEINKVREFLDKKLYIDVNPIKNNKQIINRALDALNLKREVELYRNRKFKRFIGENTAEKILKKRFKAEGPKYSTDLLNNYNIDDTLERWAKYSEKLFNKKFYFIPFQMIDFETAEPHGKLTRLSLYKLKRLGYDSFGVVINTDVSSGGGKHWFALFGDLSHKGTRNDPDVLEYFNSSGNPPRTEITNFLERIKHEYLRDHHKYAVIKYSAPEQLQYSKTECGVWSLMYIKSRLQGKPIDWFYKSKVNDNDIKEMRKHIFS